MRHVVMTAGALALAASTAIAQVGGVPGVVTGIAGQDGTVVSSRPGQAPPRDQPPRTGTSQLRGRVVAADTGQPLRKAAVRLNSPELREGRSTNTGPDGQYEFRDLPAGRYTLFAAKGSYVSLSYGQTRPRETGTPIELGENQLIDRLDFRLPRGAIITGRVLDEFGEPVPDANVIAMRQQYIQGARRMAPAGRNATTNDIGEFRLFGLAPGDYYLQVNLRGAQANIGVDVSDDRTGYAPTFYPGTADVASAQRVRVEVGATVSDLQVTLALERIARVSGVVLSLSGERQTGTNGMVMAMSRGTVGGTGPAGRGVIKPDGTFTISGVSPGEYVLQAMLPNSNGRPQEWLTATVTVNGQDVTGVQLVPPRLASISGRILTDGNSASATSALRPEMISVMLMPASPEQRMGFFAPPGPPARAREDFSFQTQVAPGKMLLTVNITSASWGVKSVRYRGADVTDAGLDIAPGTEITDIEVELTTTRPEVTGQVTNQRGELVSGYTVVVFAQDRELWSAPFNRRIATLRPDQQGRFRARTLRPGDYYAIAFEYLEPDSASDPDFLESVSRSATSFRLGDDETKTLDLKLSPLP